MVQGDKREPMVPTKDDWPSYIVLISAGSMNKRRSRVVGAENTSTERTIGRRDRSVAQLASPLQTLDTLFLHKGKATPSTVFIGLHESCDVSQACIMRPRESWFTSRELFSS